MYKASNSGQWFTSKINLVKLNKQNIRGDFPQRTNLPSLIFLLFVSDLLIALDSLQPKRTLLTDDVQIRGIYRRHLRRQKGFITNRN